MSDNAHIVLYRAQVLLKNHSYLVPLHIRKRVEKALEVVKSNPEYAGKLLDVIV